MAALERITRTVVRGLGKGEKVTARGVIAERLTDGDVRYSVQIMVDGVRIARVIGRESEGVTPTQAEEFIETARTRAREDRLDLPQGRKLHQTFREAAGDYLKKMEEAGGKDLANKKRHLKVYLVPGLGRHRVDQLSGFILQKYRRTRREAGASEATVNRELATFLHMMNRAVEWRWIKADQKPKIPRVAEERKPRRALSSEQTNALMDAAIADQDGRLWLFVAIGLGTGMRHGEIIRRRYDEIDWVANRFEIDKAKAGARLQPFPGWVRDALRKQQAMDDDQAGWIFPAERKHCKVPHRRSMDDGFKRAVKRAGLDPSKVTPHLMRHTLVTNLSRTVDIATIQKISGHKTAAMVLHYTHVNDERIDNALGLLDQAAPRAFTSELPVRAENAAGAGADVVQISSAKSAA
jgi:integrase